MPSIRDGASPDNSARMITEVKDYATENPDAMAELIHTWVTDRSGVNDRDKVVTC